jgi:hypothetical protein
VKTFQNHKSKETGEEKTATTSPKAFPGRIMSITNNKIASDTNNKIASERDNERVSTANADRISSPKPMKQDLLLKLEGAEKWMTHCGVCTLVLTAAIAFLGTEIQYSGPDEFALFMMVPILDQISSYFLMRVIAVSIEKISSGRRKSTS